MFLLTWAPLDWHDRPPARATATGDGDDCEVVLYVPLEHVLGTGEAIAVALGSLAASVLSVGAAYEQALAAGAYPQLAFAGNAPGMLSQAGTLSDLPPPQIAPASAGWEPIDLGAIQDLVQEAFGPVDLDRSPVRLSPVAEPRAGCPACAGERFGFPAALADRARGPGAEALERVEAAADGPPDAWTHLRTTAVHAELGDRTRAEAALRRALALARGRGDAEADALVGCGGRQYVSEQSTRWSSAAAGSTIDGMAVRIDASLPVHPLTVDDLAGMVRCGILTEDDRVELLDGVLVEMSPPSPAHLEAVTRLTMLLVPVAAAAGLVVTPQCPLNVLSPISQPEPDLAVVPPGGWEAYPVGALLVIEVSVTSRAVDLGRKAAIYAAAAIPEYWVLDIERRRLVGHRDPAGERYASITTLSDADVATAAGLPLTVAVADLLPPTGERPAPAAG